FVPLSLAFIMLTLGLGLTAGDFFDVAKRPSDFFLGAFLQIIGIPAVGFVLVFLWPIPPELALGLMILAASPGGPTSNFLTGFVRRT
ncbi:MAG: hypothetical protein OES37_06355, partial [Chromatiales bacterium]|nr:hypothetical protein [Chromatiales bacterium]